MEADRCFVSPLSNSAITELWHLHKFILLLSYIGFLWQERALAWYIRSSLHRTAQNLVVKSENSRQYIIHFPIGYLRGLNLVIIAPVDVVAPKSFWPSTAAMRTKQRDNWHNFFGFLWLLIFSETLSLTTAFKMVDIPRINLTATLGSLLLQPVS